jgi:hypothetical protein
MSSTLYTCSSELAIRVDANPCAGLTRSLWTRMSFTAISAFSCCLPTTHQSGSLITHLLLFILYHPSLLIHHLTFTSHFLPSTFCFLLFTLAFLLPSSHLPPSHPLRFTSSLYIFAFAFRLSSIFIYLCLDRRRLLWLPPHPRPSLVMRCLPPLPLRQRRLPERRLFPRYSTSSRLP